MDGHYPDIAHAEKLTRATFHFIVGNPASSPFHHRERFCVQPAPFFHNRSPERYGSLMSRPGPHSPAILRTYSSDRKIP